MIALFPLERAAVGIMPSTGAFDPHPRDPAAVKLQKYSVAAAFVSHEQEKFTVNLIGIKPHGYPQLNRAFIKINKPVFHREVNDIANFLADKAVSKICRV